MSTLQLSLVGLGLRVAVTFVVLVNTLLLARVLGPAGFGEYFLFYRLVSVLAAFADFGLPQSVNAFYGRHLSWRRSIHRVILGFIPVLWLTITLTGGIALWLGKDTLLPYLMPSLVVTAFGILPLSIYANLWNGMMIGAGGIWRVNLVQLIMCSLSLLLTTIFVIWLQGGLLSAAVIYTCVMLVQFLVMVVMAVRTSVDQDSDKPPTDLARQMLSFGLRGYPGSISSFLWTRLPVFVLNISLGPGAVGVFSLAQQVVEKMLLPVQSVRDVIYQKMSVLAGQSAAPAMNRYVRITLWGMLVIVGVGAMATPLLVLTVLGPQYVEAISITRILLAGAVFSAISLLLDTFFVNQLHRPGLVSIVAWLKFFVGMSLATLLILAFGGEGLAAAIVFTQVLGTLIYLVLYVRMTRTHLRELLFIDSEDVKLIRDQLMSLARVKGQSSDILRVD